ncbi:MAG: GNAT family N-acetyltransferase [Firmicutes bacterium]|nr:GNAT family N-acetyltransferase [Bacillota bacterium]
MEIIRATESWQQAGACYVRIQAMARQHRISLREEFDEHDGPGARYIVVIDDYLPVATGRIYEQDRESMMIGRVVVLPEYRGQGLGRLVMAECESWIRELGYRRALLESRDNKTGFYRRLGYAETGEPAVEGVTFRCIPMAKELDRA